MTQREACNCGDVVLLTATHALFKRNTYELAPGPYACFLEQLLESRFH